MFRESVHGWFERCDLIRSRVGERIGLVAGGSGPATVGGVAADGAAGGVLDLGDGLVVGVSAVESERCVGALSDPLRDDQEGCGAQWFRFAARAFEGFPQLAEFSFATFGFFPIGAKQKLVLLEFARFAVLPAKCTGVVTAGVGLPGEAGSGGHVCTLWGVSYRNISR